MHWPVLNTAGGDFFPPESNSINRKNNKGELSDVIWELNLVRQRRRKKVEPGISVVVDYNLPASVNYYTVIIIEASCS